MANIKQTVNHIANRPMDRKEFLVGVGAAVLTLLGISAILRSFSTGRGAGKSSGYGSSPYGR